MKLSKDKLRNLIIQELSKIVDEDVIVQPDNIENLGTPPLGSMGTKYDDEACPSCGNYHDDEPCPHSQKKYDLVSIVNENCGCENDEEDSDMKDYSLDSMDVATPGEALGIGCSICGDHSGECEHNTGFESNQLDNFDDDMEAYDLMKISNLFPDASHVVGIDHPTEKSSSYMAKPQLNKIAKYANKLYYSIPEGYELDDWMRSHLSSIADDISEVYHSIDHKLYKGEM